MHTLASSIGLRRRTNSNLFGLPFNNIFFLTKASDFLCPLLEEWEVLVSTSVCASFSTCALVFISSYSAPLFVSLSLDLVLYFHLQVLCFVSKGTFFLLSVFSFKSFYLCHFHLSVYISLSLWLLLSFFYAERGSVDKKDTEVQKMNEE